MSGTGLNLLVLLGVGGLFYALSLLIRHGAPRLRDLDASPWSSTLSYVATAYGVVVGFSILLLFGTFNDARQAVGDEATSIGTAYEEARLFPDDADEIQSALICYSQAVPTYEWPAMRRHGSAAEVDLAYRQILLSLADVDEQTDGTFQPATATNLVAQVGNISTARETRLVAAQARLPVMLWILLLGGGLFVIALIFVVTLGATPLTQAALVSLSAMFTTVMVLIVLALTTPFARGEARVRPELIEDTTATMVEAAPDAAALPCAWEADS